jgi:hypothetical protein
MSDEPPITSPSPPGLPPWLRLPPWFWWPAARRVLLVAAGLPLGVLLLFVVQCQAGRTGERLPPPAAVDPHPDLSVTFSNELIAALIQQSVDSGAAPVRLSDVRVTSGGGALIVQGNLDLILGFDVGGRVDVEPLVEDGRLEMRLRQARLGPLPVPAGIERLAQGPINERLGAATAGLPVTVTGARVGDGGLTVTARVRVEELRGLSR